MLWREAYQTRVLTLEEVPAIQGKSLAKEVASPLRTGIILGGFDVRVQAEQGVWRRLIQDQFGAKVPVQRWLIKAVWKPKEVRELSALFPPSEQSSTFVCSDIEGLWNALIPVDRPERGFSLVLEAGIVRLGMLGPATEEAWDVFREAVAGITPIGG